MTETTVDKLLNSRFEVEQPAKGYRIAVDTLLLASSIPAKPDQKVLELGCGVGGVMLALATRVPAIEIIGLELQPEMAALCTTNIARNDFSERLSVEIGDVARLPDGFLGKFDYVMMNPPYHDHKTHSVSANSSKRIAHAESDDADLAVWIEQASRCLQASGMMNMIHRADRLQEILPLAERHFNRIEVKPIIARPDALPKRIIIRGVKGSGVATRETLAPLVLYGPDNRYSEEAEAILRQAQAMRFA